MTLLRRWRDEAREAWHAATAAEARARESELRLADLAERMRRTLEEPAAGERR